MSLQFSKTFDGDRAQVGDVMLTVSEQSISHATGLPKEGERWFKKGKLNRDQINRLLKLEFHLVKLGKGFPRHFMYEKWKHVLFILQKFITCEGKYTLTFQC